MKKILLLFLIPFLIGCGPLSKDKTDAPTRALLANSSGENVGMATPISQNIYVTADHLFREKGQLFWAGKSLSILGRSFDYDIAFIEVPEALAWDFKIAEAPPVNGEIVFWNDGEKVLSGKVESVTAGKIKISGKAGDISSGAPVFSDSGELFGVLTGADPSDDFVTAIRMDYVLDFFHENLE